VYLGRGALFCPPSTLQCSPGGEKRLMNKQELLRLEGIEKSFGPIRALQNVSLVLYRGEVLGLVGDNGAGKSTLVKVISGAVMPDRGKIFFEGRQVHLKSPKDSRALGIEMVYQDLSLCESLTVAQNLFLRICSLDANPQSAFLEYPSSINPDSRTKQDGFCLVLTFTFHQSASRSNIFQEASARA